MRHPHADPAVDRSADEKTAQWLLAAADENPLAYDAVLEPMASRKRFNSMSKRLLGSEMRARTYWSRCREMVLRALTFNIMILRRTQVFYRARQVRFWKDGMI